MPTVNSILREIKNVPANRLEELYQFVHSMTSHPKQSASNREKILSFGGAFDDMAEKDYADFVEQTNKSRKNLFDRNIEL